jgi:hypothetical protein
MKSKALYAAGVICFLVVFWVMISKRHEDKPPAFDKAEWVATPTNSPLRQISKPVAQFTPDEMAALTNLFNERFRPAIDKWASAYAGHIPFDVSKITLDKFYSVNAGNYTFMIGNTTFTIMNNKRGTKVFYMMTKQGAADLNSIPKDGRPHDISVPIKADEVLKMAEADTGLKYELKDIDIKPTAVACSIDGGAFVEVGIKHQNGMEIVAINNLSFVVDSNGMLVTYLH